MRFVVGDIDFHNLQSQFLNVGITMANNSHDN